MKFIFALLLLLSVYASEEDYSVEKKNYKYCGVELSYSNFKEYIESHEQVLVEFYSETCPACKRLEPVWNRISCEVKKEFPGLVFAKIEGNHNLDIIEAYGITHTPTIAFFQGDIRTPTRYNGGKYYEALKYFIRDMRNEENKGSPAMLLKDLDQTWMFTFWRGATDQSILPNISGFFETKDCDEYREYVKACVAMGDSIRLGESFNMTVRDAYELPKQRATLVMFRDFDEKETIYDGEWKAEAIVAWAQMYSQRTIGRADSETIKNYFKGSGIMVQLFVNGSYVNENWYEFQDYLFERVAQPIMENKVRERNTFSIIASDGVEYAHWMTNAGMESTELPGFFLIDFSTGLKYGARGVSSMETLDTDLYKFIDEYTLGLLPPLRNNNEEDEL